MAADALVEFGRWIANPGYFLIEWLVLLLAMAVPVRFSRLSRGFDALARRRVFACALAGVAPVVLRVAMLPWMAAPLPEIHDEFSLLLGADTFARGRMTNAPHALAEHFESFHVLREPTYMTMYPPGQSLLLAVGQVAGHPWTGVLLGTALMGAALTWMLQQWLPPRWALLGGLLAGARYGTFSYWMNSYWGGQLAAAGGALVLGAAGRAMRHSKITAGDAAIFACGAALLSVRRPFEGLVVCAAAGGVLTWVLGRRAFALRPVVAALAVIVPVLAGTAYYQAKVTGDPMVMPQMLAARQYLQISYWIVLPRPAVEPEYRHAAMRDYYRWEVPQYEARRARPVATAKDHFVTLWRFYAGPALSVGLLGLAWAWRDRRIRTLLPVAAAGAATMSIALWMFPHYAAPFAGAGLVLSMQGMRHLAANRRGEALVRAACIAAFGMLLLPPASRALGWNLPPTMNGWWVIKEPWERHRIAARLQAEPGRHLVLVRYEPGHDLLKEWVYNGAEIDGQKVVWARSMDEARDARLEEYYRDRTVWLLTDDGRRARLERVGRRAQGDAHLLEPAIAENR